MARNSITPHFGEPGSAVEHSPKIHIIGIGDDGLKSLTAAAQELVLSAQLLIGSEAVLRLVPESATPRMILGQDLQQVAADLEAHAHERVVLLASGDPLFYGVARYLCNKLGKHRFEVLPHVSSMQLAFARVKESWEEAYLTNLAARPLETVIERLRIAEKVGLFTTDELPPQAVAQALLDRGINYFTAYVCENLGLPDERVTHDELADIAGMEFAPLNCMILVRKPNIPDRPSLATGRRLFGNADEHFHHSKPKRGLLTPAEIRVMALAELDLGPSSILWDVGAGSGSVAIEAAQIAHLGTAYAIEMDVEDHALILANQERFGVSNLVAVLGQAPVAWANLPDPDCVFIDGSGRDIVALVEPAYQRLKLGGRLVANLGSLENLVEVHAALIRQQAEVKVWMMNLARGEYQMERIRFAALNPTFLIGTVKK